MEKLTTEFTLAQLIDYLCLPQGEVSERWLLNWFDIYEDTWGGRKVVCFPYMLPDGRIHMVRVRIALSGDRFRWRRDIHQGMEGFWDGWGNFITEKRHPIPYGLWIPPYLQKDILWIVEGETDVIALVRIGIPALGLPGKSTLKPFEVLGWLRKFAPRKIYLLVEADAVEEMKKLASTLLRNGFLVTILRPDPYKDILDWRRRFFYSQGREPQLGDFQKAWFPEEEV